MSSRLYDWLDGRLNLKPVQRSLLDEPIPGGASWIYVFGSATLFLFVLQAATGMFLALYYAPTPDHAYDSVRFIETDITLGWFVRGLHHWGASYTPLRTSLRTPVSGPDRMTRMRSSCQSGHQAQRQQLWQEQPIRRRNRGATGRAVERITPPPDPGWRKMPQFGALGNGGL